MANSTFTEKEQRYLDELDALQHTLDKINTLFEEFLSDYRETPLQDIAA